MAKIGGVEDLPSWYKLQKYSECDSFDATDWANNLYARHVILEYVSARDSSDGRQIYPLRIQLGFPENYELKMLEEMRVQPKYRLPFSRSSYDSPVRPLTHWDIAVGARVSINGGSPSDRELWRRTLAGAFETDWPNETSDYSSMNTALRTFGANSCELSVDLTANDSVLIEAFTAWLRSAKSQLPEKRKRELPAYKAWARYGLLPYLDLLIWSKEARHQISHHVMAEAVGYRKGGDSFRKTVPPLAKSLMINGGLAELEALASIEASRNN
tara:strand:+ start:1533 stop:2345 length:813 start_codon:yes stop_codon:yes gene_type:complete